MQRFYQKVKIWKLIKIFSLRNATSFKKTLELLLTII